MGEKQGRGGELPTNDHETHFGKMNEFGQVIAASRGGLGRRMCEPTGATVVAQRRAQVAPTTAAAVAAAAARAAKMSSQLTA